MQGLLYSGELRVVAEFDGANQVVSRFVYGTRANVPELMHKGGVTYRIVTDPLGSVRLVVDAATGAIAQRIDYDEWGNATQDTSPGFQPFGFAGGLQDPDTGLVRFGARDYDPQVGRWTTKDPIGFGGGDTNLYGYVAGDPVNRVDPSGLGAPGSGFVGAGLSFENPGGSHSGPYYKGTDAQRARAQKSVAAAADATAAGMGLGGAIGTSPPATRLAAGGLALIGLLLGNDPSLEPDGDNDNDGIPDDVDPDADNDGLPNEIDPDPLIPCDASGGACYTPAANACEDSPIGVAE